MLNSGDLQMTVTGTSGSKMLAFSNLYNELRQ